MEKKNVFICVSESQRNPKRCERYRMCEQYAKKTNLNVKGVFKFQYDNFEKSKDNLLRTLEANSDVNIIMTSDCTRISRSIPRMMDLLIDLEKKDIAVYDVSQRKYITFRDILLNSTKGRYATKQRKELKV